MEHATWGAERDMKRLSVYCFQEQVNGDDVDRWWVLASSKLRARKLGDAGYTARLVKVVSPPPRELRALVAAGYEGPYFIVDGIARDPETATRLCVVKAKLGGGVRGA